MEVIPAYFSGDPITIDVMFDKILAKLVFGRCTYGGGEINNSKAYPSATQSFHSGTIPEDLTESFDDYRRNAIEFIENHLIIIDDDIGEFVCAQIVCDYYQKDEESESAFYGIMKVFAQAIPLLNLLDNHSYEKIETEIRNWLDAGHPSNHN